MTPFQKNLLDKLWQHFRIKGEWPLLRSLHSEYGKKQVREAFLALGGSIAREEDHGAKNRLRLSLLGVLLTSEGIAIQTLIARYFQFQRKLFKTDPEKQQISSPEIAIALSLTAEQTDLLGRLVSLGSLYGGSCGTGDGAWTAGPMKESEEFPDAGDLKDQVAEWALRLYRLGGPVFLDQQIRQSAASLNLGDVLSLSKAGNEIQRCASAV